MSVLRHTAGLDCSAGQAVLIEPDFNDVGDALTVEGDHVEGDGALTKTATVSGGSGISRWTKTFRFVFFTQTELRNLYDAAVSPFGGPAKSFWIPSWVSDFSAAAPISPTDRNLIAVRTNAEDFAFSFEPDRYGVFIESTGGLLDVYKLSGYDPDTSMLKLSTDIAHKVELGSVRRIGLVRRARLVSDAGLPVSYVRPGAGFLDMSLIEVLDEGVFV